MTERLRSHVVQQSWRNTCSFLPDREELRVVKKLNSAGDSWSSFVSTSIEGTEVAFNHIDEYDDSESENETEETSSSQLSHVLVGNGDHESPAELSFLTTRNSPRSGRTLRVSSRLLDYIWSLLHVLKYNNQFFLLLTLFFIFVPLPSGFSVVCCACPCYLGLVIVSRLLLPLQWRYFLFSSHWQCFLEYHCYDRKWKKELVVKRTDYCIWVHVVKIIKEGAHHIN
jgi:hypothetical protein